MRSLSAATMNRLRRPPAGEKPATPTSPTPSSPTPQPSPSSPAPGASVAQSTVVGDQSSCVKVFVRVRPFNDRERQLDGPHSRAPILRIDANDASQITVLDPKFELRPRETYTFDRCFWSVPSQDASTAAGTAKGGTPTENKEAAGSGFASQSDVYDAVGRPVLCNAVAGFNGCIFAYGQTGSGKTFTMMGYDAEGGRTAASSTATAAAALSRQPSSSATLMSMAGGQGLSRRSSGPTTPRGSKETNSTVASTPPPELPPGFEDWDAAKGIIPRITAELFTALATKHLDDSTHSFRIEVQYYEVYNEKVYDLLDPSNAHVLRVRQDPLKGPFVEFLTTTTVEDEDSIARLIKRGSLERHTAATKANERSSRSHAILTLTLIQIVLDSNDCPQKTMSKVNLVDLAGSERTSFSCVEGQRFTEATKINLSLTTLGRVIDCLADQSCGKGAGFTHCPYRESNLTWLLMDSLGGNSKTTMVATVSPSVMNLDEVIQTLRYASRARQIVNKVVVNEDPQTRRVKELAAEVERLSRVIADSNMCPYTSDYVTGLEDAHREVQQELAAAKSSNASLRIEVEALNIKVKAKKQQPAPPSSSDAAHTLNSHSDPAVHSLDLPQRAMSSHVVNTADAAMSERLTDRKLFSRSDNNMAHRLSGASTEESRERLAELTTQMRSILKERNVLSAQLKSTTTSCTELSELVEAHRNDGSIRDAMRDAEEILSAEQVYMIERYAMQLEERDAEIKVLRGAQSQVWLDNVQHIAKAIRETEQEQRDVVAAAAAHARSDLKTLLFKSNAATEKIIGDKAKDALQKKHAMEIRQREEDVAVQMAEAKEGYVQQIVEERERHESIVRVMQKAHEDALRKAKRAVEATLANENDSKNMVSELEAKVASQEELFQKQLKQMRAHHEKELSKLKDEMEAAQKRFTETTSIAVADAQAKARAALEETKKAKDKELSTTRAERDHLASRLASVEAELGALRNATEDQRAALAKREKQLQEWQRSLQTAHVLELDKANEHLAAATHAREHSHERHESDASSARAALERSLTETFAHSAAELQRQCLGKLSGHDARLSNLQAHIQQWRQHQASLAAASECALKEKVHELEDTLRRRDALAEMQEDHCHQLAVQRDVSHERHENTCTALERSHKEELLAAELERKRLAQEAQELASHNQRLAAAQWRAWCEVRLEHIERVSTVLVDASDSEKASWFSVSSKAVDYERTLGSLASQTDVRVERLTQALHGLKQVHIAEKHLQKLEFLEVTSRLTISADATEDAFALFHRHASRIASAHGGTGQPLERALESMRTVLSTSDDLVEAQLCRHTNAVDTMLSTFLASTRQQRWHMESVVADAKDHFQLELSKQKSLFAEAMGTDLELLRMDAHQCSEAMVRLKARADVETAEASLRCSIVQLEDDACEQLLPELTASTADGFLQQHHTYLVAQWETFTQDFLRQAHELAVRLCVFNTQQSTDVCNWHREAEEEKQRLEAHILALSGEVLDLTARVDAEREDNMIVARERDSLAEATRHLELKLGAANLEVLEADLIRTQIEDERAAASSSGGGLVGTLVRKIWTSSSLGRATPVKGSAPRDDSQRQASLLHSEPNAVATRPTLALHRLSSVPRGAATPRVNRMGDLLTPRGPLDAAQRISTLYGGSYTNPGLRLGSFPRAVLPRGESAASDVGGLHDGTVAD